MDIVIFQPLVERLSDIDRRLEAIEHDVGVDPISALDDCEVLCGDGFVAIQLYMIERKGEIPANSAYDCGPRHRALHIAHIINTAANYRKHRGEWPKDESRWRGAQHRTLAVFRDAGVTDSEFLLYRLLTCLTEPARTRFAALVPKLVEWRQEFDRLEPTMTAAVSS